MNLQQITNIHFICFGQYFTKCNKGINKMTIFSLRFPFPLIYKPHEYKSSKPKRCLFSLHPISQKRPQKLPNKIKAKHWNNITKNNLNHHETKVRDRDRERELYMYSHELEAKFVEKEMTGFPVIEDLVAMDRGGWRWLLWASPFSSPKARK